MPHTGSRTPDLWSTSSARAWRDALDSYELVIAQQGVKPLTELDAWYRDELPGAIARRARPHVTHRELVRITEWKMARGVWRGRNLALVQGNVATVVERVSAEALAAIPDAGKPISALSRLAGVGPATASAVAAAAAPHIYPFFDELVAAQVPDLGKVAFSPAFYARYASALRDRAARLGWTPVKVEQALWAHVGGKAAL